MRPLHIKLFRELWKQRSQMASIGAVVAVGIMTVLTLRGAYECLALSRDTYYREARFPDVWADLLRAPESTRHLIEDIPGVDAVDTRVTFTATLDVPGVDAPALGRFISIPEDTRPRLSDLHVTRGRYLAPGRRDEVLISKNFALANHFAPGDTLRAVIHGRVRELDIVGIALSAEYVYAVPPGALTPDDRRFGVIWMSRAALGPAYDMSGAFNQVLLTLAPGADRARVIAHLDRILDSYGGLGAYGRDSQPSHVLIEGELEGDRTLGTAMPMVFLLVAAFLLNIVLGRMITLQRTEIGVLKAFGFTNAEVGRHYLGFAMLAVLLGSSVGIALGIALGTSLVDLYATMFDFPGLHYEVSWELVAAATAVSAVSAAIGAFGAVRRAVALPPAEAMRPERPATFRAGLFERMGLSRLLPASGKMILRNIERAPMRVALSSVGVSFSVAILIVGMFFSDGFAHMMDIQFRVAQREDISLTFLTPLSPSTRYELAHLAGVTHVETFRTVPVRLRAGHREREAAITGMSPDGTLRRIVDEGGRIQPLPAEGLVMSAQLAQHLGVGRGDVVRVEVLEGHRRHVDVVVSAVVDDAFGLSIYMNQDRLHELAGGPASINGAYLSVDPSARTRLNTALKRLPAVAGVGSPAQMLASVEEQMASLYVAVAFLLMLSGVICVAVVYNGARTSLSERGRELASLRVLGFTRREVATLLLGEQAITTLIAVPLGWAIGYGLAGIVAEGLRSDTYRIPLVVNPSTFVWATLATLVSALVSAWLVARRLDRMDLIEVLKTRE